MNEARRRTASLIQSCCAWSPWQGGGDLLLVRMVFQAAAGEDYWQGAVAVVVAFVVVAFEGQLIWNLSSSYLGAERRRTPPLMRGL